MGNNSSSETLDKVGYRVLGVQSHSPAAAGGLVSFFDFIVAANGVPLRTLDSTFVDIIKASEDKPLQLTVYNCKSHTIRDIVLTPSRNWPGEGMLGVVIRFDSYHEAEEHLCHVLEIQPNSPAELAGLQAQNDYLLGTAECAFKSSDDLFAILQANLELPVEFYVYNIVTDEVRVCVLMPSAQWGGQGILGASVGVGYLHTFPALCCQTLGKSAEVTGSLPSVSQSPFGQNKQTPQEQQEIVPSSSSVSMEPAREANVVAFPPIAPVETVRPQVEDKIDVVHTEVPAQAHLAQPAFTAPVAPSAVTPATLKTSSELGARVANFFNPADFANPPAPRNGLNS